jgi:hypothetical protein
VKNKKPSNRPNLYWGHGLAPVECRLELICHDLDFWQYKSFIKIVQKQGIYYSHNESLKSVMLAFQSKEQRDVSEIMLKIQINKYNPTPLMR